MAILVYRPLEAERKQSFYGLNAGFPGGCGSVSGVVHTTEEEELLHFRREEEEEEDSSLPACLGHDDTEGPSAVVWSSNKRLIDGFLS